MPLRFCQDCPAMFDMDDPRSPGLRCPACQTAATRRRNVRANTTSRGYGSAHQKLRAKLIAAFTPGQPCTLCGHPITSKTDAQLGHDDTDRTRWRGLEHVRCNEQTSTRR